MGSGFTCLGATAQKSTERALLADVDCPKPHCVLLIILFTPPQNSSLGLKFFNGEPLIRLYLTWLLSRAQSHTSPSFPVCHAYQFSISSKLYPSFKCPQWPYEPGSYMSLNFCFGLGAGDGGQLHLLWMLGMHCTQLSPCSTAELYSQLLVHLLCLSTAIYNMEHKQAEGCGQRHKANFIHSFGKHHLFMEEASTCTLVLAVP